MHEDFTYSYDSKVIDLRNKKLDEEFVKKILNSNLTIIDYRVIDIPEEIQKRKVIKVKRIKTQKQEEGIYRLELTNNTTLEGKMIQLFNNHRMPRYPVKSAAIPYEINVGLNLEERTVQLQKDLSKEQLIMALHTIELFHDLSIPLNIQDGYVLNGKIYDNNGTLQNLTNLNIEILDNIKTNTKIAIDHPYRVAAVGEYCTRADFEYTITPDIAFVGPNKGRDLIIFNSTKTGIKEFLSEYNKYIEYKLATLIKEKFMKYNEGITRRNILRPELERDSKSLYYYTDFVPKKQTPTLETMIKDMVYMAKKSPDNMMIETDRIFSLELEQIITNKNLSDKEKDNIILNSFMTHLSYKGNYEISQEFINSLVEVKHSENPSLKDVGVIIKTMMQTQENLNKRDGYYGYSIERSEIKQSIDNITNSQNKKTILTEIIRYIEHTEITNAIDTKITESFFSTNSTYFIYQIYEKMIKEQLQEMTTILEDKKKINIRYYYNIKERFNTIRKYHKNQKHNERFKRQEFSKDRKIYFNKEDVINTFFKDQSNIIVPIFFYYLKNKQFKRFSEETNTYDCFDGRTFIGMKDGFEEEVMKEFKLSGNVGEYSMIKYNTEISPAWRIGKEIKLNFADIEKKFVHKFKESAGAKKFNYTQYKEKETPQDPNAPPF